MATDPISSRSSLGLPTATPVKAAVTAPLGAPTAAPQQPAAKPADGYSAGAKGSSQLALGQATPTAGTALAVATPGPGQQLLNEAAMGFQWQGNTQMEADLQQLAAAPLSDADAQLLGQRAKELAGSFIADGQTGERMLDQLAAEQLSDFDHPDGPDPATMQAVAAGFDALGMPEKGQAVGTLSDPGLTKPVRDMLMEALQNPPQQGELIREAREAATSDADRTACDALAKAWLGGQQADGVTATAEVTVAQQRYDQALQANAADAQTLAQGLQQMQGMSQQEQDAFTQAFKASHPTFAAVEQAQAGVVEAVTRNQDAIAQVLSSPERPSGVDPGVLGQALAVAAHDPAGVPAAAAIATTVLGQAGQVPSDQLDAVTQVLPDVVAGQMAALARAGTTGGAAAQALAGSDLGKALAGLADKPNMPASLRAFGQSLGKFTADMAAGDDKAALGELQQGLAQGNGDHLNMAMLAIAGVIGVSSLAHSSDFMQGLGQLMSSTANGANVYVNAAKALAFLGKNMPVLKDTNLGQKLALNATMAGAQDLATACGALALGFFAAHDAYKGNYMDAAFEGVASATGIAALMTGSGGLGLAVMGIMLAKSGADAIKGVVEDNGRRAEIAQALVASGQDPALADFVAHSREGGTYGDVTRNLGLQEADVTRLLKEGGVWTPDMLVFLGGNPAVAQALGGLAADGKPETAVRNLIAGLAPDDARSAAALLGNVLQREVPDPQERVYMLRELAQGLPVSQAAMDRLTALLGGAS